MFTHRSIPFAFLVLGFFVGKSVPAQPIAVSPTSGCAKLEVVAYYDHSLSMQANRAAQLQALSQLRHELDQTMGSVSRIELVPFALETFRTTARRYKRDRPFEVNAPFPPDAELSGLFSRELAATPALSLLDAQRSDLAEVVVDILQRERAQAGEGLVRRAYVILSDFAQDLEKGRWQDISHWNKFIKESQRRLESDFRNPAERLLILVPFLSGQARDEWEVRKSVTDSLRGLLGTHLVQVGGVELLAPGSPQALRIQAKELSIRERFWKALKPLIIEITNVQPKSGNRDVELDLHLLPRDPCLAAPPQRAAIKAGSLSDSTNELEISALQVGGVPAVSTIVEVEIKVPIKLTIATRGNNQRRIWLHADGYSSRTPIVPFSDLQSALRDHFGESGLELGDRALLIDGDEIFLIARGPDNLPAEGFIKTEFRGMDDAESLVSRCDAHRFPADAVDFPMALSARIERPIRYHVRSAKYVVVRTCPGEEAQAHQKVLRLDHIESWHRRQLRWVAAVALGLLAIVVLEKILKKSGPGVRSFLEVVVPVFPIIGLLMPVPRSAPWMIHDAQIQPWQILRDLLQSLVGNSEATHLFSMKQSWCLASLMLIMAFTLGLALVQLTTSFWELFGHRLWTLIREIYRWSKSGTWVISAVRTIPFPIRLLLAIFYIGFLLSLGTATYAYRLSAYLEETAIKMNAYVAHTPGHTDLSAFAGQSIARRLNDWDSDDGQRIFSLLTEEIKFWVEE